MLGWPLAANTGRPTERLNMPALIKTRRSCIGCGLCPGALYANGLCEPCQNPPADTYDPIGNRDDGSPADDAPAWTYAAENLPAAREAGYDV